MQPFVLHKTCNWNPHELRRALEKNSFKFKFGYFKMCVCVWSQKNDPKLWFWDSFPFGCFLKWWYPQNTPKWSFLGTTILGNPHFNIGPTFLGIFGPYLFHPSFWSHPSQHQLTKTAIIPKPECFGHVRGKKSLTNHQQFWGDQTGGKGSFKGKMWVPLGEYPTNCFLDIPSYCPI